MSQTFFTSDTHFGHENIIKFCNRPFATVEQMNETIIQNWNAKVSQKDEVFHLGDFSFYNNESVFHKLNGRKHLIVGNHDAPKTLRLPWASPPEIYREIKVHKEGAPYPIKVILFHYPIEEWNGHFGQRSIHFYGHVHGRTLKPNTSWRFDVGVDSWDYHPVTLDEILAKNG